MKNLTYIHYAIELRTKLVTSIPYTDYDGSTQLMDCDPHRLSFRQSNGLSKESFIKYEFMKYEDCVENPTNRRTTKSIRKMLEHNRRHSDFLFNQYY